MVNRFVIMIFCLLAFATASAAEIDVHSDRDTVALNESFELVYQTAYDVEGDPDFSVLENQLDILSRSQSNNISIINGETSSSQSWKLTVMARREGKLELPPVPFGSDLSPPLTIQVNAAQKPDAGTEAFYTRVRLSSESAYVQQQLIVTQQLFSPFSLTAYGLGELQFSGVDVVIEPLGEEKQYRTRIGDKAYIVVEKRFAVFPQQDGVLTLAPALAEGQARARSGSLFDPFGSRGQVVRARSTEKRIEVKPVPAAANMNPWLPADDLQVLEQWPQDPPRFTVGEPLTRTLSIKAEGLTAAQLPELARIDIEGVKQYPDQPLLENIRNDNGISGYRVEKVAFIPTRPGEFKLPAIEIPWWNSKTGKREVAKVPARTIEVAAAPNASPIQPPQQSTVPAPQASEPTPQPDQPPQANGEQPPAESAPGYWMWLAVVALLGWLATAVSWWVFNHRQDKAEARTAISGGTDPRTALREVIKACKAGDASACRAQLIVWGRAEFGEPMVRGLSDLTTGLPTDIVALIRDLDASLYGGSDRTPDFDALIDALKRFSAERARKSDAEIDHPGLQPLYK